MKKLFAALLAVALTVSLFAGCAKKGYRTVDEIKSSGEIVLLTNAMFEPYEYIAGGKVVGADIDLAQLVADELGVKLKILDMDFDGLVDALASGKGDFIAAGMANNPERAKVVDFSIEYVHNSLHIIIPADSTIAGVDDLAGKRIAVQEGTTSDDFVRGSVPDASVLAFKDAVVAGNAVSDGRADACILDLKPAEGVAANSNGKLIVLDEVVGEEELMSMAAGKGNQGLVDIINSVLRKAIDNGTVDERVQYHMDATTGG
ncbi:MAG: ABC transporter substrate-binding protein [Oscillospiraceae bacterium]|jgi:polar amino acid transport system substrate-binding protein|nr:ABC transporter substrate-binding protein [Oscillospiraceae bacterium]